MRGWGTEEMPERDDSVPRFPILMGKPPDPKGDIQSMPQVLCLAAPTLYYTIPPSPANLS